MDLQAQIKEVESEAKDALNAVRLFKVETQEQLDLAYEITKEVKLKFKQLEELRTSITKPQNEALRKVNSLFKPAQDYYKQCEALLKNHIVDGISYLRKKQAETLATVALQTHTGDIAGAKQTLAEIPDAVLPPNTSLRENWDFEVADLRQVPDEYLMTVVDVDRVRNAIRSGIRHIKGLNIYNKTVVAVRVR